MEANGATPPPLPTSATTSCSRSSSTSHRSPRSSAPPTPAAHGATRGLVPTFRLRFRAAHTTAPLLGLFFDHPGVPRATSRLFKEIDIQPEPCIGYDPADDVRALGLPTTPSFVHAVGPDRDQAAPAAPPSAAATSCSPSSTSCPVGPTAGSLLCNYNDDQDAHDKSRVRATVFSAGTGEWSFLPWVDAPPGRDYCKKWLLDTNMQADGSLYRVYWDKSHLLMLDTVTMEFSFCVLPWYVRCTGTLHVGETKNGKPCIVHSSDYRVTVLLPRTDSVDGVDKWIKDKVVSLDTQLGEKLKTADDQLKVVAVVDGCAYLATSTRYHHSWTSHWVFFLLLGDNESWESVSEDL
ncbi:hypothetical protein PR202_gb05615 [Eleusine coracana subsp. coracana]|uniref:Uncharacterized protein n=1 Tax=Eleusine coracana subsp. coracana TaxID=191504 RepID=A0AAV5E8C6_ELECO|nr:hypothetical protein PR202_gb05615 [Eleusine coracana subsp. coracana]